MEAQHLEDQLRAMLARNDRAALDGLCASTPPALLGELLGVLRPQEIWGVLGPLPSRMRAEVFCYLDASTQLDVVEGIKRRQLASLMDFMDPDDRADFYKRLDAGVAESLLPLMVQAERDDLKQLLQAEEGTVGSVMSTDYVRFSPDITLGEALVQVREQAPDRETIYYNYVVDDGGRLIGFLSLKDMIVARPVRRVREIMRENVISIEVEADQEEAAILIEKYDLVALPVVDAEGVLVGIVTHDDAIDIVREEHQEDLEHFMGMTGPVQDVPYLRIPFWVHFRRRVAWIVGLLMIGLSSGALLKHYEASIGAGRMFQALTIYIPMLINTGGNAGQQSVTTVMRSLILGQLEPRHVFQVLARELGASALLSASVAVFVYAGVFVIGAQEESVAGISTSFLAQVVTLALMVHIIVSALMGAALPMIAARLKLDPTVIASPALTTLADLTGLVVYFNTALLLLPDA